MKLDHLKQTLESGRPHVIAIEGPSGSGKSVFTSFLEKEYNVLIFHTDDYFLPGYRKTEDRLNEPGGNIDYERMEQEIFNNLNEPSIPSNRYDCQKERMVKRDPVPLRPIIIIEGVYSMHPLFRPYFDLKVFIDVDKKTQLKRILERSGKSLLKRFKKEWIPLENKYFDAFSISKKADIYVESSTKIYDVFTSYMV